MNNYFDKIKKKLTDQFKIEDLEIIDNSHLHKGHKSFSKERFQLCLKIKSIYLYSIPRVDAHKFIMKALNDDLKNKIHALEINIEQ